MIKSIIRNSIWIIFLGTFARVYAQNNLPHYLIKKEIDSINPNQNISKDSLFSTKDENKEKADPLNIPDENIQNLLQDLHQKAPKLTKFIIKTIEALNRGYYNVDSFIDIGNLFYSLGKNDIEGTRIRIGARTYFSPNDMWRVQGYGAYGFRDNQFKYGLEAKYMLNKTNRWTIGAATRRDIVQLGVHPKDNVIMRRTFTSSSFLTRGNNPNLSNVHQVHIFSSIEPIKNLEIRIDGSVQSISSANPSRFNTDYYLNNEIRKNLNDSHISVSIIAKPLATYSETGVERKEQTTNTPTIALKYTKGIQGLFNADFGYNKLQLMYTQPIPAGTWGKSILHFEAGKNFEPLPLALQNIIPGNQTFSPIQATFSQLNYYEFVADKYATIHLEHYFNGKIFSHIPLIKILKWKEIAIFRAAIGSLSDASKNMNVERIYSAPNQYPYYEYGLGIENIGLGNFRIFRVDFNWRGNYLYKPNAPKFGIKAGIQMNF